MNFDSALPTFIAESRELLQAMEEALLRIEQSPDDADTINAIFRAAHTIKGSAGLFGLDDIVAFTHVAESVLDKVRSGELRVVGELVALLLATGDHMTELVNNAADGGELTATVRDTGQTLIDQLHVYLGAGGAGVHAAKAKVPAEYELPHTTQGGAQVETDLWHISLRFGRDVYRSGMDPLSFIRYLGTLGDIHHMLTLFDAIPAAQAMDPEICYLGFEISFKSNAEKAAIESVFDFVSENCRIRILPPRSRITEYLQLIADIPGEELRVGEMLVRCGTLTQHALEAALRLQHADGAEHPRPMGEVLMDAELVPPPVVAAALEKQRQVKESKSSEANLIRVDAEKLDPLTHLVRNSMDHGIEFAELRLARGKPAKGTLKLNVYHRAGSIVIEVSDDGGGLNKERILKKAIERGLVSEGASLSDKEIHNLIFEAGFSTAEVLSNLSGRGVGMDVVRRNIQALRGTVDLDSVEGQGSTVRIRLPLTLAIIDGFLVGVGRATYVIPLDMVVECIELSAEDRDSGDKRYLNLRGEVLPYRRLREHFVTTDLDDVFIARGMSMFGGGLAYHDLEYGRRAL